MKKKEVNKIYTPKGAMLGERVNVNGECYMKYKASRKTDILSPKQIVELVTGCKVEKIIYEK